MKIEFSESAAPLQQLQKAVTAGIEMSPSIAGTWFWTNDKELQFAPKNDWPVDGAFTVRLAKKGLLARQVQLEDYRFKFRSQPFAATITESQFYQDPRDPNLKKLVATVKFSHPVDPEQLESRVSLAVAKDAEYLGLTPDSRHFTVAYDKFKLAAFIHSAALAMPRDDTPMTLRVDKGVRAARGGNDTSDRLDAVVTIPGRTSLRFADARMTVVDNARYEPEQILLLNSSSPVVERAFAGKVSVQLLPVRHPGSRRKTRNPTTGATKRDWRRHPRKVRYGRHELRAVGRRRRHRARFQVPGAGRPLPPRPRQGRRAGHGRLPLGEAVRRRRSESNPTRRR